MDENNFQRTHATSNPLEPDADDKRVEESTSGIGAMNGLPFACRDFTEFLAGTVTEHMGFTRGKLETMSICARVERNTCGISC